MPGIDWDLKFRADTSELSSLKQQLKDAGVSLDDVKKKAAEQREYERLVHDLKRVGVEVDGVTNKEEKLAQAEQHEGAAAREAKKEHEDFFGKMLEAEVIGEQIREIVDRIEELGEEFVKTSIEAVDFEYKSTVALEHMTGSAEAAKDILERAHAFANGVGDDFDKVAGIYQKLAATGLKDDNLTAAATAAKDLSIVTGQSFDSTAQLFEMIGSDRGLGGRAARQLAAYPQLLNELEKHFGFVPGTAKSFEHLTKKLEEAPVKGAEGLALLESMVTKVAHEEQLGDVGVEIGESFSGAAQRFENDWKGVMESIAESPAIGDIRKDLSDLADYFDPASEGGKELADSIRGIDAPAKELFDFFKENKGLIADALSAGIESAKFALQVVVDIVKGMTLAIEGLQLAAQYLGALFETGSFKKATEVVQDYYEEKGLKNQAGENAERQRRMSPSERKEEEELSKIPAARELPALAPLPAAAEGGSVMDTGLVTVHEGETIVPANISQSSSSSSSSTSVGGNEFHFHIEVPAGNSLDEQLLAAKLSELAPGAIMSALEQMNQMRGGR